MARQKLKSLVTCFTPEGDCFCILSPNEVVKIWNTNSGSLLAETRVSDANSDVIFSCMACSFVGKKRKRDRGTCLLALGTDGSEIFVVDVFTGERKWKASGHHAGGITGLSFTNRGRILRAVGNDSMASELYSETGEVVRDFKVSKVPISSVACSDEKVLAVANAKIRIFSWENGKELLKFSIDGGPVQHMNISEEAKAIVTSRSSEKHIQVWKCQLSTRVVSKGPVLQMKHSPFAFECMNGATGKDSLVVLSISESGIVYIWNLKTVSETDEEIKATKVTAKASEGDMGLQNTGSVCKSRMLIIAARLQALESDGRVTALIAYGSADSPRFSFLDISNPVEDIVITAGDGMNKSSSDLVKENDVLAEKGSCEEDLEAVTAPAKNGKGSKKRSAPETYITDAENLVDNGHREAIDGSQIDEDLNEPTLGEKLASLDLLEKEKVKSLEKRGSSQHATPPSADSVHVMLKQALHADDQTLLINCLNTQDEKVVTNSVSLLNPSDVLKLLDSLISIIQSRGAVLVCALPWLRSLLLEHASGIMSQESSLTVLNSLYQLIESRVSNFQPALQLSSCLDFFYTGTIDDGLDEIGTTVPVIYEDKDDSEEEEEPMDAMETDEEGSDLEPFQDVSDTGGSDDIGYD